MVVIEPLEYEETTNIDEHNQMVGKINEEIAAINHIEDTSLNAATEAARSATESAQAASDALDAASAAAEDAGKVNTFDERIKASVTHISTTGTASGVSIGYATDGKPSPQVQVDIPVLDGMSAGVMTPAQMKEIGDQLDTLGRDLNNVKAEYLDRYNLNDLQLVRSRTEWEKSPLFPAVYAERAGVEKNPMRSFDIASLCARTLPPYAFEKKSDVRMPGYSLIAGFGAFSYTVFRSTTVTSSIFMCKEYAFENTNAVNMEFTGEKFYGAYKCFATNEQLTSVSFKYLNELSSSAFIGCSSLTSFVIEKANPDGKLATIANTAVFGGTPIESGAGFIYVPDDLVEQYKAAPNWMAFAAQIKPVSQAPEK